MEDNFDVKNLTAKTMRKHLVMYNKLLRKTTIPNLHKKKREDLIKPFTDIFKRHKSDKDGTIYFIPKNDDINIDNGETDWKNVITQKERDKHKNKKEKDKKSNKGKTPIGDKKEEKKEKERQEKEDKRLEKLKKEKEKDEERQKKLKEKEQKPKVYEEYDKDEERQKELIANEKLFAIFKDIKNNTKRQEFINENVKNRIGFESKQIGLYKLYDFYMFQLVRPISYTTGAGKGIYIQGKGAMERWDINDKTSSTIKSWTKLFKKTLGLVYAEYNYGLSDMNKNFKYNVNRIINKSVLKNEEISIKVISENGVITEFNLG
jgi:hypothetical protein